MPSPVCGFVSAHAVVCVEPSPCTTHHGPRWRVCAGCGGKATRACPTRLTAEPCNTALCPSCIHHKDGAHGPVQAEKVAEQPSSFAVMQDDLEAVVGRILAEQAQAGLLSLKGAGALPQVSKALVQGVGLHLMVLHMSALARHAQAQP